MIRSKIYLLVLLLSIIVLTGCSSSRKSYSELRGLMLIENTQIGRNRSYYSKHSKKKISAAHKKMAKSRKFK
jgi:hypothetical protein